MKKYFIIIIIFASLFGFVPNVVSALTPAEILNANIKENLNAGKTSAGFEGAVDPRIIVTSMIQVALSFVGIIFVALIFYGGFLFFTAGGENEKIEKGTKIFKTAIVGLAIILFSYGIVFYVDKYFKRAAFTKTPVTTEERTDNREFTLPIIGTHIPALDYQIDSGKNEPIGK